MAKGKAARSASAGSAPATAPPPLLHVPTWFRVLRWTMLLATIAIAIGMLALLDQHLTGISWVYDGSLKQYTGRNIKIQYCMLSSRTEFSTESRCNFAFAVPSVSLALSFIWTYLQTMRRNTFKHPKAKLADLVLCTTWLLFWLAAAVVLCVWTDAANKVGSFLGSAKDQRNGLCVMAWVEFLLVAILTGTAGLLFSRKCPSVFASWEAKHKQKKVTQEQERLQAQQAKVAQQEAAAAAAKQAAAPGHAPPTTSAAGAAGTAGGAPRGAAAAAGASAAPTAAGAAAPATTGRVGAGAVAREEAASAGRTGVPVSTNAAAAVADGGAVQMAARGADDNPFK